MNTPQHPPDDAYLGLVAISAFVAVLLITVAVRMQLDLWSICLGILGAWLAWVGLRI